MLPLLREGVTEFMVQESLGRAGDSRKVGCRTHEGGELWHQPFRKPCGFLACAPKSLSAIGRTPAGLLLALCHWRACQQQALRDPRSILVGEW